MLGMTLSPALLHAADTELITIIGPDGRPMNIERKVAPVKPKATVVKKIPSINQTPSVSVQQNTQVPEQALKIAIPKAEAVVKDVQPKNDSQTDTVQKEAQRTEAPLATVQTNTHDSAVTNESAPSDAFLDHQGETYVDSDYLEEQEFNLEGKKRFYHLPGFGGAPIEVIERKKGVATSLFDRFTPNTKAPTQDEPVVFAATYMRVDQSDVQQMLDKTCVTQKSLKKAKTFNFEKATHLWPSQPIKNELDYHVIKIDAKVQELMLTSYASSEKSPQYYWPFVAFLDQKGCMLEGVMGFRTSSHAATAIQHAAISGAIRVPENAQYIFMTPLEVAIDAEDFQLTNHGQLKLVALR